MTDGIGMGDIGAGLGAGLGVGLGLAFVGFGAKTLLTAVGSMNEKKSAPKKRKAPSKKKKSQGKK